MISYGSVCSGIEAASVAWHPLGMRADWLSEIEPFPSAVLAARWPEVPNLGDMTKIARRVLVEAIPAPDVLVGGTPCQAFSVAGMREGLADPRGALTIKYVELLDAIDHVRTQRGEPEAACLWENVPGVLSDKGNAFGNFLAALVGESEALEPAGPRWTNSGCVYGPRRTVAWRVLDAQYFGLAQRRRRVFVVASARAGFDPAAVLLEREGLRRDHPPRRGEGQDVAGYAPFGPALQCGCGHLYGMNLGAWGCPNCEGDEGPAVEVLAGVPAFGGENQAKSLFQAGALTAHGARNDFASETFCVHGVDVRNGTMTGDIAHTVQAGTHSPDPGGTPYVLSVHGTQDPNVLGEMAHTLGRNSGQENAVFAIQAGALRTNPKSGPDGIGVQAEQAYTIEARAEVQAVAFTQNSRSEVREINGDGQIVGALAAEAGAQQQNYLAGGSGVRRLTPRECERLQGFPDDYTLIPGWDGWRPMDASETPESCQAEGLAVRQAKRSKRWYVKDVDGPRYKAIGNSKAIPVVRWIGRRLMEQLQACPHFLRE